MFMTRLVKFKGISKPVKVSRARMGSEGISRKCYSCQYTKNGKKYVVKYAYTERGKITNRFEYRIYQHAKHTIFKKFYPDFRAVSKCGKYLLLERCKQAIDTDDPDDPCDIFPDFMQNDVSEWNWGYTLQDNRPVMFDLGYDSDELSEAAREVGVPDGIIEELYREF